MRVSNKFLLLIAGVLLIGSVMIILMGGLNIASAVEFNSQLSFSQDITSAG